MVCADKEKAVNAIAQKLDVAAEYALELAERSEEVFLTETGRQNVPEKAFWLWIDIAKAIHKQDTEAAGNIGGEHFGKISSIKRGDTSISYDRSSEEAVLNLTPSLITRIQGWRVIKAR